MDFIIDNSTDENRKGCPISIVWDKEKGEDWIIFKDQEGKEFMRIQKFLWENETTGFTAEIRDKIIDHARRCYG